MNELFKPFMEAVDKTILFKDKSNKDNASYLAKLCGKRIGMYNEPSDGCEMKEDVIKSITGNDLIIAKPLYRDPFSFIPIIKMWILSNKTIMFDSCSEPMIRRTNIIKFNSTLPESPNLLKKKGFYKKDNKIIDNLMNKYRDEFFTFVAMGANAYYENGRAITKAKSLMTEEEQYLECIDPLREFINEKCVVREGASVPRVLLFEMFIEWCKEKDKKMMKREDFYKRLTLLKYQPIKIKGYDYFKGLDILTMNNDNEIEIEDLDDPEQVEKVEEVEEEEKEKPKPKKPTEPKKVKKVKPPPPEESSDEEEFDEIKVENSNKKDFTILW